MADTTGTELALENSPKSVLQIIAEAARDPAVDADKIGKLLDAQERIMDRAARDAYIAAFDAMSLELPSITKKGAIENNSGKVQSRYAKWEDIHRVITPILRAHGFVLSHKVGATEKGAMAVCAVLTHQQGHREESGFMPLPIDASGNKNPVQGIGSAQSYGKRYTTIAMLNIVTHEDTDGRNITQEVADANAAEKLWITEAEEAARKGVDAYAEHFRQLARAAKLYLVSSGEHERIKALATKPAPVKGNFDDIEQGKVK